MSSQMTLIYNAGDFLTVSSPKSWTVLRVLILLWFVFMTPFSAPVDHDQDLDASELIKSRGFISETHKVITRDGYILTAHRVINPLIKSPGRPVMLQHGLCSSGLDFIINSPGGQASNPVAGHRRRIGNNMGFELAIEGYDVWLTNLRGNTYSREHVNMSTEDKAFWNFSFDEHIKYDVPDTIDYILKTTNHSSLGYIGHSQGTMLMFGLLGSQAKYNDVVKPIIALAPVTTLGHINSFLKHVAHLPFATWLTVALGDEFLPSSFIFKTLSSKFCRSMLKPICSNLMGLLLGYNEEQLNKTRIAVYANHSPAGTSAKNIVHFIQSIKSGTFQKFDYGQLENQRRYGSAEAPKYGLENITNEHIALFRADNDLFCQPKDLGNIRREMKVELMLDYVIPIKQWNHADYLFALESGRYVNSVILQVLGRYN